MLFLALCECSVGRKKALFAFIGKQLYIRWEFLLQFIIEKH